MEFFKVNEFQNKFDELMERVENGEHIGIIDEDSNKFVMIPADDEIIKLYTNHEEGS